MRISDWSSDVCSSDLLARLERLDHRDRGIGGDGEVDADVRADRRDQHVGDADDIALQVEPRTARIAAVDRGIGLDIAVIGAAAEVRSEEHTSELQSLMRISDAVFCLKKKNTRE